jgi:hypothetical protein
MQSASNSYHHKTGQFKTANNLSVIMLPKSDTENEPITFVTDINELISIVNKIANNVYLVTKVDRDK